MGLNWTVLENYEDRIPWKIVYLVRVVKILWFSDDVGLCTCLDRLGSSMLSGANLGIGQWAGVDPADGVACVGKI